MAKKKVSKKRCEAGQMPENLVCLRIDDLPEEITQIDQVLDLYSEEELRDVQRLVLDESLRSTQGVDRCPNLVELYLANNPLEDLNGVSQLEQLQGISLSGSFSDLSPLGNEDAITFLETLEVI